MHAASLVSSALAATLLVAAAHSQSVATTRSAVLEAPGLEDIAPQARYAVSRVLGERDAAFHAIRTEGGLRLVNERHRLTTDVSASGVTVTSGSMTLGLDLWAVGYGTTLDPVGAAKPIAAGNRVELRRDQLTEWFVNGPLGVQQGFTLESAPARTERGQLTLSLRIRGGLLAAVEAAGTGATFYHGSGAVAFTYGGLIAFDATGRLLPAVLRVDDQQLSIAVDDAGAEYPIVVDPLVQHGKLTASDGAAGDLFGQSVAIEGDTIVCGAKADDADTGAAYVFVRPGTGWTNMTQVAKLTASDGTAGDEFGISVAIDNDQIVVGARSDNGVGSAYVFEKPGGGWTNMTQTAKLTASDGALGDLFGLGVGIHANTIVVGAWKDDDNGIDSGSAYVFAKAPGTGWVSMTESGKLTASDGAANDGFGAALAISGVNVVIGARNAGGTGRAYVFVKPGTGWTTATENAKLTASDGDPGDSFGIDVDIEANTVVVGAWGDDDGGSNAGAAYVFVKPGTGWVTATETAKLRASDAAAGDSFGRVSVHGARIAVGAPMDGDLGIDSGSVYLFDEPGSGWTTMTETQKVTAGDGAAGDQFGIALGLATGVVVVGAWHEDHNGANSGSAYVFGEPTAAPRDVALVDADVDGDLDVATADSGTDSVSIRTNSGSGALGPPVAVALTVTDSTPVALTAADLDGDGDDDDLAVACSGSDTVALLLDAGTGTITSIATGGAQPVCIAAGNLNGNATDDLVVGRIGRPFVGGYGLAVRIDGGAFVELPIPAPYPNQVVELRLRDLDGDGDVDLVAVAQGGPDHLLLFAGDGTGNLVFADAIALPTSGLADGLCCADLDGDGEPDLAVALPVLFPTPSTSLRVHVYSGNGTLTAADYTAGGDIATGGTLATDIECGEFDGDTIPGYLMRRELVVVHAGSGDVEAGFGLDAGTWSFASVVAVASGSNPVAVAVGDLNGDGFDDVVITNQGSNDVTVSLSTPAALAQAFGTGCAGTGGYVPALTGTGGAPTVGNSAFGTALSDALALAPTLAMLSFGQQTAALSGGCELFLEVPLTTFLRFTNSFGADSFVFGIPNIPSLVGLSVFFQTAVFDQNGSFAGILALSNGLRVQVGS